MDFPRLIEQKMWKISAWNSRNRNIDQQKDLIHSFAGDDEELA